MNKLVAIIVIIVLAVVAMKIIKSLLSIAILVGAVVLIYWVATGKKNIMKRKF